MTVRFTDKDKGWAHLQRQIEEAKKGPHAAVGIFGAKASADHGGRSNIEIAVTHEFGLTFEHPGGTAYLPGGEGKKAVFVSNTAAAGKDLPRTKPHKIMIPERSFIRGTVDANATKIARMAKKLADQVLAGCAQGVGGATAKMDLPKALEMLGVYVQGLIRGRISAGIPPALKAATIRRKGSSKPLINTGQLRASIDFAVRPAKASK